MPHHQHNDWCGGCHTNILLTGVAIATPVLKKIHPKKFIRLRGIFLFFMPHQFQTASGAAGCESWMPGGETPFDEMILFGLEYPCLKKTIRSICYIIVLSKTDALTMTL